MEARNIDCEKPSVIISHEVRNLDSEIKFRQKAEVLLNMLGDSKWHPVQKRTEQYWQGERMTMILLDRNQSGMTAGDLSSYLGIGSGGVANILNSLENKGLIERKTCREDRRKVMVTLSEKGIIDITEKKQKMLSDTARFLKEMGEDDSEELLRLTEKILKICDLSRIMGAQTGEEKK